MDRLKCLMRLLEKGQSLRPEVVQKNLKLAVQALDNVLLDDDDTGAGRWVNWNPFQLSICKLCFYKNNSNNVESLKSGVGLGWLKQQLHVISCHDRLLRHITHVSGNGQHNSIQLVTHRHREKEREKKERKRKGNRTTTLLHRRCCPIESIGLRRWLQPWDSWLLISLMSLYLTLRYCKRAVCVSLVVVAAAAVAILCCLCLLLFCVSILISLFSSWSCYCCFVLLFNHKSTDDDDDDDDVQACSAASAPLANVISSTAFTTATTTTITTSTPSSHRLHPGNRRGSATAAARMAIRRRSAFQSSTSSSAPAALKTRSHIFFSFEHFYSHFVVLDLGT